MAVTIANIFEATEPLLRKKIGATAPAAFEQAFMFKLVKHAYDRIGRLVRLPRKQDSTVAAVAGTRSYSLPTDCLGGITGVITLEFNGKPLEKHFLEQIQAEYGDEWLAPPDLDGVSIYFVEESQLKFSVLTIPTSTDATKLFRVNYVQSIAIPTATSDTVPTQIEHYHSLIPLYVVGRAMETENRGRGAALIQEFESRILYERNLEAKQGRRLGGDNLTQRMRNYMRRY